MLDIPKNTLSHYDPIHQVLFLVAGNNLTAIKLSFSNHTIDYKDYKNNKRNQFNKIQRLLETELKVGEPEWVVGDNFDEEHYVYIINANTIQRIAYNEITHKSVLTVKVSSYSQVCQRVYDIAAIKSEKKFIVTCGVEGVFLLDQNMSVVHEFTQKYKDLAFNFTKIRTSDSGSGV